LGKVKVVSNPLKTYLWHNYLVVDAGDISWIVSVIVLSVGGTFLILYVFRRWSKRPSLP
jgi:hypothetical protein